VTAAWRRLVVMPLLAAVLAGAAIALLAGGSVASTRSCNNGVRTLSTHLSHVDVVRSKGAKVIYASLKLCPSPDAWRVHAYKSTVVTSLGRVLHDSSLNVDRALDVLCTNFDAYDTTRSCKNRLAG
jgi:hypothetical protein